jgi:hypothetical protein
MGCPSGWTRFAWQDGDGETGSLWPAIVLDTLAPTGTGTCGPAALQFWRSRG